MRAQQLISPSAGFEAARLYRSPAGVPIATAFEFMSSLYFRGKIAYARRFARGSDGLAEDAIQVIAPGFGLVAPGWRITAERMEVLRSTAISVDEPAYREPLARDCARLAARAGEPADVVLLGSVATGKYVDVMRPALGSRLYFPAAFAGRGDMSRGSVLLRAVRDGRELEYAPLEVR